MAIRCESQITRFKKFEKLLEPRTIVLVKTRNRMIQTGAGMFMWHENDLHIGENMKALYESIARGGVGPWLRI